MRGPSALRVVLVHPDLLGTYGDGGNATVLARRLAWRGIGCELVEAPSDRPVPSSGDVYCLGGGEDGPEEHAAGLLRDQGTLGAAVAAGAAVLAVCAGFQVAGVSFTGPDGEPREGLGLLDTSTTPGKGPRAVGEVLVDPAPVTGLPTLTGYENHQGVTTLGRGAEPLGTVRSGVGNGAGGHLEGARAGRVVGTYLHGPVLARNPALADMVLSWVTGPLEPLDDAEVVRLRSERFGAATTRSIRSMSIKSMLPRLRRAPGGRG